MIVNFIFKKVNFFIITRNTILFLSFVMIFFLLYICYNYSLFILLHEIGILHAGIKKKLMLYMLSYFESRAFYDILNFKSFCTYPLSN